MVDRVRIARRAGYSITLRGEFSHYPPGDYSVPGDMSLEVANRALASGCATEVRTKDSRPETKTRPPAKKKRSKIKTGKAR